MSKNDAHSKFSKMMLLTVLFAALAFGGLAVLAADVAWADTYFNSSEPGCNAASPNPNYLMCDDFEDGSWAYSYYNAADVNNNGWLMSLYSPGCGNGCSGNLLVYDAAAPQYARCGGFGAVGTNCTADSGPHNPTILQGQAYGMGEHPLKSPSGELYIRLYYQASPNYVYAAEKFINPNVGTGGGITFGTVSWPFSASELLACPLYDCNGGHQINPLCRTRCPNNAYLNQNVGASSNVFNMTNYLGHWIFIEVHVKANTSGNRDGIYELWIDDCGLNGRGCTGTPTLRARYNNVQWTLNGVTLGSLFVENWANPGPGTSSSNYERYDQIIVSKTGPIGFMGVTPPTAPNGSPSGLLVK